MRKFRILFPALLLTWACGGSSARVAQLNDLKKIGDGIHARKGKATGTEFSGTFKVQSDLTEIKCSPENISAEIKSGVKIDDVMCTQKDGAYSCEIDSGAYAGYIDADGSFGVSLSAEASYGSDLVAAAGNMTGKLGGDSGEATYSAVVAQKSKQTQSCTINLKLKLSKNPAKASGDSASLFVDASGAGRSVRVEAKGDAVAVSEDAVTAYRAPDRPPLARLKNDPDGGVLLVLSGKTLDCERPTIEETATDWEKVQTACEAGGWNAEVEAVVPAGMF